MCYTYNMKKLSVIFVGTGAFGAGTLEALAADKRFSIPFVITAPDKEIGRGLKLTSTQIKKTALANKLIVHESTKVENLKQKIIQAKADFILVVAFGEIIPISVLKIPKNGSVNIHGSLLPKYRGASPIQESILCGDRETGLTWIHMNEKMDAGDIIEQAEIDISPEDTYETLGEKLAQLSSIKTGDILAEFALTNKQKPQDQKLATYCHKISKKDGEINLQRETAEEILRKIRAYAKWPGCYFWFNEKRIKIIQAHIGEQKISTGEIEMVDKKFLALGTREGTLLLTRIQPESKREMSTEEFLRGYKN